MAQGSAVDLINTHFFGLSKPWFEPNVNSNPHHLRVYGMLGEQNVRLETRTKPGPSPTYSITLSTDGGDLLATGQSSLGLNDAAAKIAWHETQQNQ
ncbi:hypothetical protein [Pseudoclavibacter sp. RFBB5]|uniref:hypothetical protein n=1 Tax=Pseudoclavibacter sp. RFBB5 TaxID=2080574 RepID=UPI0011AFF663|nr:hypothetical protein [Pseudoclavibacter sp. RFBB5]